MTVSRLWRSDVRQVSRGLLLASALTWKARIRLDPVRLRVALPAANPPDNRQVPRRSSLTPFLQAPAGTAIGHPMTSLAAYRQEWLGHIRADLLSGQVVALALIPEAIAFSIIAGVDPKVGLYASFSIAVINRHRGRAARHDLGRHRRHGGADGHARSRLGARIPAPPPPCLRDCSKSARGSCGSVRSCASCPAR